MADRFQGKCAIVTGAAGGIGEAIATRLVAEGASVVIADLKKDAADSIASKIGERAMAFAAMCRKKRRWRRAARLR